MNRSAAEITHWAQEYGAGATRAEVERDLQQNSIGTTDFCNARNFPLPEIGRALDPNS